MKKTLFVLFISGLAISASAQTKTAPAKPAATKPAAKPVAPKAPAPKVAAPALKTTLDSMSYAIGMLDGNFFKQQGLSSINGTAMGKGFSDVLKGETILTPEQADMVIRGQLQQLSRRKIQPEVTIGTQVWTSKNLDVSTFRNGDPIPEAKTEAKWKAAGDSKQPAWCYYNNDQSNGTKYGKLYNWYAVNDPRGHAPKGYHIPTYAELTKLEEYLGNGVGDEMKSTSGWLDGGNGTNSSGFSGLPGGSRDYDGAFEDVGRNGRWWISTESTKYSALFFYLISFNGFLDMSEDVKVEGRSVRCIRD
jgi:uncharacterized protein (TIGR02145 family)